MEPITILNRGHRFRGFVYQHTRLSPDKRSIAVFALPSTRQHAVMTSSPSGVVSLSLSYLSRINMKRRILIVEDDVALLETLTDRLENENYAVRVSTKGDAGFEEARIGSFDLILLDLMLPGRNGLEICSELRRRGLNTPILMLTARVDVTDRVLGLRLGGDDYLQKPFHMSELMARIDALIRRSLTPKIPPAGSHHFGCLEVDLRR